MTSVRRGVGADEGTRGAARPQTSTLASASSSLFSLSLAQSAPRDAHTRTSGACRPIFSRRSSITSTWTFFSVLSLSPLASRLSVDAV